MKTVFGGLIQKEWIMLKRLIFWIFLLDIVVITVAPPLVTSFAGRLDTLYDNTHIIVGVLLVLHIFAVVFILFESLKREMRTLDMWLHSPTSMVQLVGAKLTFAVLLALGSLFFSGFLGGVVLYVIKDGTIGVEGKEVLALVSVVLALSIKLIFMTATGWFFWSVYKVIKSRLRFFSIPFILLFIVSALVIWEQLRINGFFDWLRTIVSVRLTDESFYNEHTSYFFMGFVPDGIAFSVGNLAFYLIISLVLLMIGSMFFEKKVRV
ncbi:hypothetical protein CSV69_06545 [Sporosarcina sp. P26b]|uniref:hypothetical protein n=1 Tax=Sporosarcina sp. P26b TaxID=2048253 RepID=UPI000C16EAF9|nr:hypothetical protein [Sporosarcina sp. P26b]PIC96581.1 hypothetical protein CSV69_06545 [Sporosarcina sp. P26b]